MHIFDICQLKNYFLEFVSWSRHTATNGPQSTARSKERIYITVFQTYFNCFLCIKNVHLSSSINYKQSML